MSENTDENKKNAQNDKDYFEKNLREILSGGDECSPPPPKHSPQNTSASSGVTKPETENQTERQSKKQLLLFTLIRAAAFAVMIGLFLMFVCRTIEPR